DVDARFLAEAVQLHQPALVLLSIKLPENLPAVSATIAHLTTLPGPNPLPSILVGGQAAAKHPEVIRTAGAVPMIGQDLEQTMVAITATLGLAAPGDEASP